MKKNFQEKITLINLITLILLLGVIYFIFYKLDIKDSEINTLITEQGSMLENLESKISILEEVNKESLAKLEIDLLEEKSKRESSEIELEKQKEISSQQISNLEEKLTQEGEKDLNKIVDYWDSYVVFVNCNFYSETAVLLAETSGSGLLVKWDNTDPLILTNKHIVSGTVYGLDQLAQSCEIKFPKEDVSITSNKISVINNNFDWGFIDLGINNFFVNNLLLDSPSVCKQGPNLGDNLVILGYPSIGDKNNVTATEGIISGFDGDYFITSAKVEKGNSGGAAISLENNCYLGTPTFSTTGNIESLARILDVRVLFE
ncbi:trypsin-like peptidase domain-containing protein [Patescibacteria group bacterium]|nr:trypsin-like peptidase domain-containing protein [Patescibacteria group bacterium]